MAKTFKGIDVSSYQGNVDWYKVAKEVDFVIIRSGFGNVMSQKDNKFDTYINGAIKAGIKNIGIYHFSYAYSAADAKKEAGICLEIIEKYKKYINLPIAFDWEYDSRDWIKKNKGVNPTRSLCDKMAKAFIDTVEEAGYKGMIYTNPDFASQYFTLSKYDYVWIAQYSSKCSISDIDFWQYSSTGRVSGISGNVDMNYCYNEDLFASKKEVLEGDVNLDGKVNLQDVVTTQKVIAGLEKLTNKDQIDAADVNNDGKISVQDVVEQQKIIANIKDTATYRIYTVVAGDTLSKISAKYLGSAYRYRDIMKLNNLKNDMIYVGQKLKIPNK